MDWQTVRYDPSYDEPLDLEIIPICDALNEAGFVTSQSCSGHGHTWPRVWFEHSDDKRIESMARFILQSEDKSFNSHSTVIRKEICLIGYHWSLEIHLHDAYAD